jgi:CheY-like chemotaxis protein
MTASPRSDRQTKASRTPAQPTHSEPEQAPPRWQIVVRQGLSALALAVVLLAPEVVVWHPLLGFARTVLHLEGRAAYVFPLCAGAAALYFGLLATADVLKGDSALANRLATWMYAGFGAAASMYFELTTAGGSLAAGVGLGALSLSSAWVWDRTLKAWRRNELRALDRLERPLPRFRVLRWILVPRQTFVAFRQSVVLELSTREEAVAAAARVRPGHGKRAPEAQVRDLALMLIANPEMTGEEACRHLEIEVTARHGRRLLSDARQLLEELHASRESVPELEIARQKAS